MPKPYYEQFPNLPHAISIKIDEYEFKYDVPDSKDGDGKHRGGWKALVRFINDVDRMIEQGELDTRQVNSGYSEGASTEAGQCEARETSGKHTQIIPEKEDLAY